MATHPATQHSFHREGAADANSGVGPALIAIGILATLVVLAFYLFNAT